MPFSPNSSLYSKNYPRDINHMPVVVFSNKNQMNCSQIVGLLNRFCWEKEYRRVRIECQVRPARIEIRFDTVGRLPYILFIKK